MTAVLSLEGRLHTLAVVSRSTEPSILREMMKGVSTFWLSNNNKWQWCVWMVAAYRQTYSSSRLLDLRVGGLLTLSQHLSSESQGG